MRRPYNGEIVISEDIAGDVTIWDRTLNSAGDGYNNSYVVIPYEWLERLVVVRDKLQVYCEVNPMRSRNTWERMK